MRSNIVALSIWRNNQQRKRSANWHKLHGERREQWIYLEAAPCRTPAYLTGRSLAHGHCEIQALSGAAEEALRAEYHAEYCLHKHAGEGIRAEETATPWRGQKGGSSGQREPQVKRQAASENYGGLGYYKIHPESRRSWIMITIMVLAYLPLYVEFCCWLMFTNRTAKWCARLVQITRPRSKTKSINNLAGMLWCWYLFEERYELRWWNAARFDILRLIKEQTKCALTEKFRYRIDQSKWMERRWLDEPEALVVSFTCFSYPCIL